MSYMRGACDIWRNDSRVHVWAEDGYDGWDDTSWAEGRKHAPIPNSAQHGRASGVGIRQEIAVSSPIRRSVVRMRERYVVADRPEKGRLLNEAVAVTGRHPKALIRGWRRPLRYFGCGVAP